MSAYREPVEVGQVWADNDWRSTGRTVMVMEVQGDKAICAVAWPGHKVRKRTTIALRRFRPSSTGYRLLAALPSVDRETM